MCYNEDRLLLRSSDACNTLDRDERKLSFFHMNSLSSCPHFVYELVDTRDNTIFYVGITIDLYNRFRQHMRCDGTNVQKDRRVQDILSAGHLPIMHTIEQTASFEEALKRELYWIHRYLRENIQLLNIAGISEPTIKEAVQGTRKTPWPPIDTFLKPWDIAMLPVYKRFDQLITAEYATDAEFQYWTECNEIPVYDTRVGEYLPVWKFDHRCYIINYALTQGWKLTLADETIIDPTLKGK